jgi:hypothetical protein
MEVISWGLISSNCQPAEYPPHKGLPDALKDLYLWILTCEMLLAWSCLSHISTPAAHLVGLPCICDWKFWISLLPGPEETAPVSWLFLAVPIRLRSPRSDLTDLAEVTLISRLVSNFSPDRAVPTKWEDQNPIWWGVTWNNGNVSSGSSGGPFIIHRSWSWEFLFHQIRYLVVWTSEPRRPWHRTSETTTKR